MFLQKSYIGKNKWYLYLLVLFMVFMATQVATIPFIGYQMFSLEDLSAAATQNPEVVQQLSTPSDSIGLGLMLLAFAVGLGALFLFARIFQKKKAVDICTGRKRFDWGRMLFGALIWGAITALTLYPQISSDEDIVYSLNMEAFLPLLLVGVLMFPFQTAFEEVLFRGYLMQGVARWTRSPLAALIVTSLAFGLMHGVNPEIETYGYDVVMPMYIFMGLIMGLLAVADGGIELALGMHFANNLLASLLVSSDGMVFKTAAIYTDMSPTMSHIDTLQLMFHGALFVYICSKRYGFRIWGGDAWKKLTPPVAQDAEK